MNKREVSELFAVMILGWPNAEMFKGGIAKLGPTISLWAACVQDVDFWTGQQAVVLLCKECKFPPTIAEFREKVQKVNNDLNNRFSLLMDNIKWRYEYGDTMAQIYAEFPPDNPMRAAISAIGGPEKLLSEDGTQWQYYELKDAYIAAVKNSTPALGGVNNAPLPPGRKQIGGVSR